VNEVEHLDALVTGRVQGVGFRYFVVRKARTLGLAGRVRNEPDGTVRVIAEGPPAALDDLERALREGPAGARVSDVLATRSAGQPAYEEFDVEFGR
jgi:acylphosphatase